MGWTNGCDLDRFCPDGRVTRGQMAAFLARALKLPAATRDYFGDDANSKFQSDINRLAAAGITRGCGERRYCPDSFVTRGQMAAFLARALKLPAADRDYFSDDSSSKFQSDINRMAAARATSGCGDGRFCPDGLVTRGQMAAFLRRALD